jgi:hypothetical protein
LRMWQVTHMPTGGAMPGGWQARRWSRGYRRTIEGTPGRFPLLCPVRGWSGSTVGRWMIYSALASFAPCSRLGSGEADTVGREPQPRRGGGSAGSRGVAHVPAAHRRLGVRRPAVVG